MEIAIKRLGELAEHIDSGWFTQDHYRMEFDKLAMQVASELGCTTQALPPISEPRFQRQAAMVARATVARFSMLLVTRTGQIGGTISL